MDHLLIYAGKVDSKTKKLSNVFIYDERKEDSPVALVAKSGKIVPVKTNSD